METRAQIDFVETKSKSIAPSLLLFFLVALPTFGIGYLFRKMPYVSDEHCHFWQTIYSFDFWSIESPECLTTLPGYHIIMGALLRAIDLSKHSLAGARLLNSIWLPLGTLVVFDLLRDFPRSTRWARSLQFAFFALLLPYSFLVYTDTFSILLLLLMMWLFEREHGWIAAGVGLLACLVRQTNVVLLGLPIAMTFRPPPQIWLWFKNDLKRVSGFVFVIALIFLWAVWNGGFAAGDTRHHPSLKFSFGNIGLFLFLYALIFLPTIVSDFRSTIETLRRSHLHARWTELALLVLLILHVWQFKADHPYNQTGSEFLDLFLHNHWAQWTVTDFLNKVIVFIPMAIGLIHIITTPLRRSAYLWVYPITLVILSLSWLIEPRYGLPAFALLHIMRRSSSARVEWLQLAYGITMLIPLLWLLKTKSLML